MKLPYINLILNIKTGGILTLGLFSSVSSSTKIEIICPSHGSFIQTVEKHLTGNGCPTCSSIRSSSIKSKEWLLNTEKYIKYQLREDSLVTFVSSENVIKSLDKFTFHCKNHGIFYKSVSNFRAGQRCPVCNSQKTRIWSKQSYSERCKLNYNGITNLYCIKCTGNDEEFYKVGITIHSNIYKRFLKHKFPYTLEVIKFISGDVDSILKFEKEIHKATSNFRYIPLLSFKGSKTECFTIEGLDVVLNLL